MLRRVDVWSAAKEDGRFFSSSVDMSGRPRFGEARTGDSQRIAVSCRDYLTRGSNMQIAAPFAGHLGRQLRQLQ